MEAYKRGCLYDAWSETFKNDIWMEVFKDLGVSINFYTTRERDVEEILPWDFISCGVSKEWLISEWRKSKEGTVTPNCKEQCNGCGAGSFKCGICIGEGR